MSTVPVTAANVDDNLDAVEMMAVTAAPLTVATAASNDDVNMAAESEMRQVGDDETVDGNLLETLIKQVR